ncbi:hypothetical protein D1AOALGA4SA_8251 [Olavius algarvensis Delta 1 endosymbiont]|nr:hypothetical protein D1AOALGA4SA_8251 [Olavius algarvensis Delta 1 endosymbiont]
MFTMRNFNASPERVPFSVRNRAQINGPGVGPQQHVEKLRKEDQ